MRQTDYDRSRKSVIDKSNPIATKWLEKQTAGRTSHISFSPAASPHSSLERQVPDKFTVPFSQNGDSDQEARISPKIHITNVKPISGTGCMVSTTNESSSAVLKITQPLRNNNQVNGSSI